MPRIKNAAVKREKSEIHTDLDDVFFVKGKKLYCPEHGPINHLLGLLVDKLGGGLGEGLVEHHFPRLGLLKADVSHGGVHAELGDLAVGGPGHLLEVVLRPGGDSLEENLLGGSPAQRHAHPEKNQLQIKSIITLEGGGISRTWFRLTRSYMVMIK